MKSIYYQFVNFIQTMNSLWFMTIWITLLCLTLILIMKFFKKYNGTQKNFEKVSLLILALICFAVLVYLSYIRK